MNLSDAASISSTAVRVVARQTMTGLVVSTVTTTPIRFGDDMPRVDPGNAGNSYLVYKLLVNLGNHPSGGEDSPADDPWLAGLSSPGPASADEISRLRNWFVRGEPMPPNGSLATVEMRAIVRWILRGAAVSMCVD